MIKLPSLLPLPENIAVIKFHFRIFWFFLILFLPGIVFAQTTPASAQIKSPDGKVVAVFSSQTADKNGLVYSLTYAGKPVISNAGLQLRLKGMPRFMQNLKIIETHTATQDTTWTPVYGEQNKIRDHYQELVLDLQSTSEKNRYFQVMVRAYNEGLAFCYRIPEQLSFQNFEIIAEKTEFSLPAGTQAYTAAHSQAEYKLQPLENWSGTTERPLTLVLPNKLYASIGEAALVNYTRMKLALQAPNVLVSELDGPVLETSPFATPWRVIMVAEKPIALLQHNAIFLNLNPPSRLKDTIWIKPGKVIRETTLSTAGAKSLVDFAAQQGLDYIHFDAGWYGHENEIASDATKVNVDPRRNPKNDLDLQEAIRYAKSKNIGVLLYVNHRALERQLDAILPLYKSWGVAGIKFGFVHTGSHRWTTWLHDAVKKCAEYNLMVNIHDDYRPTGFSRTYPNLMTQEGIRGNEEFPDATHNTVLPFTRFLAGPADYTFCYFQREEFGFKGRVLKTTPTHQLALPVVYFSPLQWLYWYDTPSRYQGEPELAFWKTMPTTWDETKVLQGEIGQYITVARRRGDEWYVGTITNNDARTLQIPLTFLEKGRKYTAEIYEDGGAEIKTRTHVKGTTQMVNSKKNIKVVLKPSGGQAIRLVPVK
ncbi:glycoside hydrolase family 97 protein [Adhaeribacter aerolatus]|uniref:glycoside hydrolase family 97 protein n=1 Tax=Adhaeribacter aerolatus TaxID=670289 RepID=UPI0011BEFFD8|nr:glycoside hydrolase family 97 protein [Adhaeribacter aerolatus]